MVYESKFRPLPETQYLCGFAAIKNSLVQTKWSKFSRPGKFYRFSANAGKKDKPSCSSFALFTTSETFDVFLKKSLRPIKSLRKIHHTTFKVHVILNNHKVYISSNNLTNISVLAFIFSTVHVLSVTTSLLRNSPFLYPISLLLSLDFRSLFCSKAILERF